MCSKIICIFSQADTKFFTSDLNEQGYVLPTSEMTLGEEVLDEVGVSREEQVMQFVYTHADHSVDVQPPAQVRAKRLHFTWRVKWKTEKILFTFVYPSVKNWINGTNFFAMLQF